MEGRRLFGTNGVRGVVNRDLTPELVLRLSAAVGFFFKGSDLTVGCDGRLTSPMLVDLVSSGLASVGCQVWNLGLVTTPALQFVTKDWRLKGGVMVTASHNPPEFNGLKVMGNCGVELPHEDEREIERILFDSKAKLTIWSNLKQPLHVAESFASYIESVVKNTGGTVKAPSLRVLVDTANGVSVYATPPILERLGGSVQIINGELDGIFPGRNPEPTPENLRVTMSVARRLRVDFAVAHDGDGDRAVFLDEKGRFCWGDQTFAIILEDFLRNHPGEKVVTTIASSRMIEDIAERYGSEVVYTPVGSVYVSNLMLKISAKLGGEENGGIFYGQHLAARDGGMTAALLYRVVAESRKPLSRLIDSLPAYYMVKDKLSCPETVKDRVAEAIKEMPAKGQVSRVDGLKVDVEPRSWVLIRPSGTEPLIRLMVEAPRKSAAVRLARDYKLKISRIIKGCLRDG